MREYLAFFIHAHETATGWKAVAAVIFHIVTGLVAYPIFGLLALVGMIPKSIHAKKILKSNEEMMQRYVKHRDGQTTIVNFIAEERSKEVDILSEFQQKASIQERVETFSEDFLQCYYAFDKNKPFAVLYTL